MRKLIPALDAAASTPIDKIPADALATTVARVLKREKRQTVVDVAMFGSAI